MSEQVFDLLGGILNSECRHLLTVQTCSICKGELFHKPYAKRITAVTQPDKVEKHYCAICPTRKPTSKKRATIRIPRTKHGVLEHHCGVKTKKGTVVTPWCDHTNGVCVCQLPPTMSGPTVEVPKVNPATHQLPDGRWACDECCFGHCQRCQTSLPQGRPGTVVGRSLDGRKADRLAAVPLPSTADLFG